MFTIRSFAKIFDDSITFEQARKHFLLKVLFPEITSAFRQNKIDYEDNGIFVDQKFEKDGTAMKSEIFTLQSRHNNDRLSFELTAEALDSYLGFYTIKVHNNKKGRPPTFNLFYYAKDKQMEDYKKPIQNYIREFIA